MNSSLATPPHARIASTDEIRSQFPALDRLHHERPVAYFDGPGGTQVPRAVVDSMTDYLLHHNANTHWRYPTSRERLRSALGELHRRGQALLERLVHGLGTIEGVRVYGPPASAPRTPTVAFTVGERPADSVADALSDEGVFVSTGDFYAAGVVKRYGVGARGGLVRAGCAAYTTADEVGRLLEGVARLAARRAS